MEQTPMSTPMKSLISAFMRLQSKLKPLAKDKDNPFYKTKYTDFDTCMEYSRELLFEHGFLITQTMQVRPGAGGVLSNILITTLYHEDGGELSTEMLLAPSKNDMQGLGGAITYGKRYLLCAILTLTTGEDDDGNKASLDNTKKSITSVQVSAITEMTKRYQDPSDLVKQICVWQGCKSIAELPASQYDEVMGWLRDNLTK